MSLNEEQTIQIGKLGTFTFEPGWYVYIGSAHGQGGLKGRTDRHRRSDEQKRKRWNVDHFRPFATMSEIWFSHAPQYREHDWAWAVMRMYGATIPATKFGANDCHPRCETHFFHFPKRPFVAEFRADLLRRWPDHPPIYTEFVEPLASDLDSLGSSAPDSLRDYDRGRRLLETMRRADYDGTSDSGNEKPALSFARGMLGLGLAEQLAPAMQVSAKDLIAAAKFADAVDTICMNCDEDVFGALFNPAGPQARKAIMQLSRIADTRQRYRIGGVLEGRFRSVAPQGDDPVFDTVTFSEIPSRLSRARGSLRLGAEEIAGSTDPAIREECRRLAGICHRATIVLRRFVNRKSESPPTVPKALSRDVVWPILKNRTIHGPIVGKFRQTLALTIKNVWDYPQMQRRGIVPQPQERTRTLDEIKRIAAILKTVLAMLENE